VLAAISRPNSTVPVLYVVDTRNKQQSRKVGSGPNIQHTSDLACPTFSVVRATSAEFDLLAGNVDFFTKLNEE